MEKQYRLTFANPVPDEAIAALSAGPTLEDGKMHPRSSPPSAAPTTPRPST